MLEVFLERITARILLIGFGKSVPQVHLPLILFLHMHQLKMLLMVIVAYGHSIGHYPTVHGKFPYPVNGIPLLKVFMFRASLNSGLGRCHWMIHRYRSNCLHLMRRLLITKGFYVNGSLRRKPTMIILPLKGAVTEACLKKLPGWMVREIPRR